MNDQAESIKQVSEAVARAINAVTDNSPQLASAAFDAMKHGVVWDGWIGIVGFGIATVVALTIAVFFFLLFVKSLRIDSRQEAAPFFFLASASLIAVISTGVGMAQSIKYIVAPEAVVINQILEKVK